MAEVIEVLISEIRDYLERERDLKFMIFGRNLIPTFTNWRTDYHAFILMGENNDNIPGVGVMFVTDGGTMGVPLYFISVDLANPDIDPGDVVRDISKHIIKFYCGPWTALELNAQTMRLP